MGSRSKYRPPWQHWPYGRASIEYRMDERLSWPPRQKVLVINGWRKFRDKPSRGAKAREAKMLFHKEIDNGTSTTTRTVGRGSG